MEYLQQPRLKIFDLGHLLIGFRAQCPETNQYPRTVALQMRQLFLLGTTLQNRSVPQFFSKSIHALRHGDRLIPWR